MAPRRVAKPKAKNDKIAQMERRLRQLETKIEKKGVPLGTSNAPMASSSNAKSRKANRASAAGVNKQQKKKQFADDTAELKILYGNLPAKMQQEAIRCSRQALREAKNEEEVALRLQRVFDTKFGHFWQCIVGTKFGSAVHHNENRHMDFLIGNVGFLLFQTD